MAVIQAAGWSHSGNTGPAPSLSASLSLGPGLGRLGECGAPDAAPQGMPGRQRIWAETKPVLSALPPTVCP